MNIKANNEALSGLYKTLTNKGYKVSTVRLKDSYRVIVDGEANYIELDKIVDQTKDIANKY